MARKKQRIELYDTTLRDGTQGHNVSLSLTDKLLIELPGILNWALTGCAEWQKNGLQHPEEVTAATAEYKDEMDILRDFIEDKCVLGEGLKVKLKDLYAEYATWCDDNKEKKIGRNRFNKKIEAKGCDRRVKDGYRCWLGVGLKAEI